MTFLDDSGYLIGGAEGDRTPDLCIANAALSQLSYSPMRQGQDSNDLSRGAPARAGLRLPGILSLH